jgi:hypothetical protein
VERAEIQLRAKIGLQTSDLSFGSRDFHVMLGQVNRVAGKSAGEGARATYLGLTPAFSFFQDWIVAVAYQFAAS